MSHSHLQAALARERHSMLLAQAQAARRAGRARPHRPGRRAPAIRSSLVHRSLGWLPPWIRMANVSTAVIADSGHFTQEEQPERAWAAVAAFALGG